MLGAELNDHTGRGTSRTYEVFHKLCLVAVAGALVLIHSRMLLAGLEMLLPVVLCLVRKDTNLRRYKSVLSKKAHSRLSGAHATEVPLCANAPKAMVQVRHARAPCVSRDAPLL